MASKPTYYELLRHPEWQKKRLKIMERDEFRCRECDADSKTLNVHHSYYTKGAKPWEYPDDALITLCEECHGQRHELLLRLQAILGYFSTDQIGFVTGYAKSLMINFVGGPHAPDSTTIDSLEEAVGFSDHGFPQGGGMDLPILIHQRAEEKGGLSREDCMQLRNEAYEMIRQAEET